MDGIIRASSFPPEIRPVLLNILSYPLDDGYFFWRKILEVGVRSPKHLALDQYSSYNAEYHHPHEFFDNFTEVLSLMPTESVVTCTDLFTDQLPYTLSFNSGKRALDQYMSLTNDTDFRCEHGDRVWLSPACRSQPSRCVPLVVLYFFDWAMQRATLLHMPLAVIMTDSWLKGDYSAYLPALARGRFLFHWTQPDDSLFDELGRLPALLHLPRIDFHQHTQGIHRTDLTGLSGRNFAWRSLRDLDPHVHFLATSADFSAQEMEAFMAQSLRLGKPSAGDPAVARIACDWIRAHPERWRGWIPTRCPRGTFSDHTLTACRPCPAGRYCSGGKLAPEVCPERSYCPPNSSQPAPCPAHRAV